LTKVNSAEILVLNGTVLTMNPRDTEIKDGSVAIDGEMIVGVGPASDFTKWDVSQVIDARGGIIMPGLVNTHTHLPMSLFRGLADDLPLMTWLNDYIFPAESKHINRESVRLGALLSCIEMIMTGTTTCCDGYFFEDEVAKAVCDSGMRAVVGQGVIDFPAPGVPDVKNNVRNAIDFVERWRNVSPTVSPSIFCHSPQTCSAETLKKAKAAATSKGVLFQVHVAETKDEWDWMQSQHKTTPIQYLDRLGIVDQSTLLIHAIWVNNDDIETLANRDINVSHNPESNMKLGSGIARIPAFLKSNIQVGLGTDGCASNNDLDLFSEMDFTAKLHKVNSLDPSIMSARSVLRMATIGGAKAIGLGNMIGSLEIGKQADLIVIDTNKPHLVPMYSPSSQIVYAARGSDVSDVIVGGRLLVRDYRLLTLNVKDIIESAASLGELIRAGIPSLKNCQ